MKKTKIDWADSSWNPVTGCRHGCEYCYARGIANRFAPFPLLVPDFELLTPAGSKPLIYELDEPVRIKSRNNRREPYPYQFEPTFYRYKLDEPARWTKPRNIFVCSMADLFGDWVPYEWIRKVFEACKAAPQHRYLFLTKNPVRYLNLAEQGLLPMDDNFWYGSSTPLKKNEFFWNTEVNTFVSIEPILEPFTDLLDDGVDSVKRCNWIIIGAETGNRKGKVIPEKSWIMEITEGARKCNVPIFMKESLRQIMGEDFIQQYPW